jgi:hypothetical protein
MDSLSFAADPVGSVYASSENVNIGRASTRLAPALVGSRSVPVPGVQQLLDVGSTYAAVFGCAGSCNA